jgi:hypothetical protein
MKKLCIFPGEFVILLFERNTAMSRDMINSLQRVEFNIDPVAQYLNLYLKLLHIPNILFRSQPTQRI